MCGLVGILQRGTDVDPAILSRMAEVLDHRGPDDEGSLTEGRIGFYHKRLSVIDLVSGHQPMTFDDVSIVFNGEIYNYVELREEPKQAGHAFRTASDTEVIIRMYIEHGPDFVGRLNGMFAFVLWDRNRRRVMAARDHMGIKPLYWLSTGERVLFASEIKALLRHPDVKAEPDRESIKDYLVFQYVLEQDTLFKGIRKLLPGQYLLFDTGSLESRSVRYWEPTFKTDYEHTESHFLGELKRLLDDAIRLQMRSDVPVGSYLSGGMDSSLVTILASRQAGGPLKTFTGAFREGPEFDETQHARTAADACGARTYEVYPTEDDFVNLLPDLIYHMDEPAAGPGLFPQYMVSRLARSEVTVCLGGQGGDEIFGGYARYVIAYLEQALKGAIFESNEEGEHIVSLQSLLSNLPYLKQYVPMMKRFWHHGAFEDMDRRYFRLVDRGNGDMNLFHPDFRRHIDKEATFARFQGVFNHPDTSSYFNKMTHYDLVCGLPALLHVEDRVSMAVSLESRVPLLDHRIVDLVTRMPPPMKFKGGEMKYFLKKAVKDILPASIYERRDKMGFPVPLHLWARGRARDFFHDVLLSRACRERGLFDADEVAGLLGQEIAFGRRLWGLLNLELWHRRFIDGEP